MFNLSGSEIIVILLLALVVLGPEKLPDALRRFGRTYGELKKMGTGFQQEFKAAMDEPTRELRETANLLRTSVNDISTQATGVVRDAATDKPVSPGGPGEVHPGVAHPAGDPADADVPFAPGEERLAPIAAAADALDATAAAQEHDEHVATATPPPNPGGTDGGAAAAT